jgi:hypothetical protein
MKRLIVNTNNPRQPRFDLDAAFFFVDYKIPQPLIARMLAVQKVVDIHDRAVQALGQGRVLDSTAQVLVEEAWQEIEEVLRPLVGASAEQTQKTKDTEAATSAPSVASSEKPASSSATKSRRSASSSRRGGATPAPSAKKEQSE